MREKGKALFHSVKTEVDGIRFDSETEANFYQYLKTNEKVLGIETIKCHPTFLVFHPFEVTCYKCHGTGKVKSPKTENSIKCQRCKGEGTKSRQGTEYTPDFEVKFKSGYTLYYDVKGFVNERFPMVKKAFEMKTKKELVVVKWDQKAKDWVFK
jgi:hypothetical protein